MQNLGYQFWGADVFSSREIPNHKQQFAQSIHTNTPWSVRQVHDHITDRISLISFGYSTSTTTESDQLSFINRSEYEIANLRTCRHSDTRSTQIHIC